MHVLASGHLRNQSPNSYNLLTNKNGLKRDLSNLQTKWKKAKRNYWNAGNELFIKDNTKIPQIYTLPRFWACQKKILEFTNSTHIIHWPEKMA